LAALCLVLGSLPAQALPIAITAHERGVSAEASASAPGDASSDDDADVAAGLGPAALDAAAFAEIAGSATGSGDATQTSDVSSSAITGTSQVSAYALGLATDAFAQGFAESLLRIEFTATADALLRLRGSLLASAQGAADAFAFVELASVDTSVDPLLLRFEATPGAQPAVDAIAALQEGVGYRLTAFARVGADALDVEGSLASAGFAVAIAEVPEPGTLGLLLCGLLVLRCRRAVGG
jgi:hypothetical protein